MLIKLLSTYIIYSYNDMSIGFVKRLSNYLGDPYLYGYIFNSGTYPLRAYQLTDILLHYASFHLNPILLNNLFLIICVFSNIFFSYKLFSFLAPEKKLISLIFSFFNSFSLYFIFRVISATPALYTTFVFPIALLLLIKRVHPFKLGLLVLFALAISNYYGYFILVFAGFWYFVESLCLKTYFLRKFVELIKSLILLGLPSVLAILVLFRSILFSNVPFLTNYTRVDRAEWDNQSTVYRPLEDFYSFSFRPWYFVIPPKSSVFLETYPGMYMRELKVQIIT